MNPEDYHVSIQVRICDAPTTRHILLQHQAHEEEKTISEFRKFEFVNTEIVYGIDELVKNFIPFNYFQTSNHEYWTLRFKDTGYPEVKHWSQFDLNKIDISSIQCILDDLNLIPDQQTSIIQNKITKTIESREPLSWNTQETNIPIARTVQLIDPKAFNIDWTFL